MGQDCCSQRRHEQSSLGLVNGVSYRKSIQEVKKRISHIYEEEIVENVDDCLENKGKDNREEQIDNSNKNPIFQVVNQEENVPTNDQQVIELEKSEEKNCAIPEQEENQKEKEQQVVEIKRENINENNNTPISQVVIQQPAVPSKSIENELIDQILTQNKLESESISFSSNFDTVSQTNVSKIEQCLKARQVPGKLSQIFLRALERKILGVQETKDPKEEQIVQVIDRPVPKVRPRKILQLSEL
ncbi:unnamed protein product (macronuclear) [Paramecium tetraurelia]|uniref:Uncharacterized protein n=1 Tax=Paramecium tetraurelia TaxID=5888 RepID=A0BR29_PARTE|nr:uncharacterized protein GSPATT00031225001 [Paramecium tetraurelia]CAK60996.1 unnamed protein product [Paramecium tetraurelia]|eukprot:XP_001428394.1 hypothetical protein (macronuclear) [Paramecium tetraurelia strain d4-2]